MHGGVDAGSDRSRLDMGFKRGEATSKFTHLCMAACIPAAPAAGSQCPRRAFAAASASGASRHPPFSSTACAAPTCKEARLLVHEALAQGLEALKLRCDVVCRGDSAGQRKRTWGNNSAVTTRSYSTSGKMCLKGAAQYAALLPA